MAFKGPFQPKLFYDSIFQIANFHLFIVIVEKLNSESPMMTHYVAIIFIWSFRKS